MWSATFRGVERDLSEAIFPLLGTAFVVLVALPVCALVAKLGLMVLERDDVGGPLHGLTLRRASVASEGHRQVVRYICYTSNQQLLATATTSCYEIIDGQAIEATG